MPLNRLNFTKDWNDPSDFPTMEMNEEKVRADLQLLHDETKSYINETLLPGVENALNEKADKSTLNGIVLGQIPDRSITEEKLSEGLSGKLDGIVDAYPKPASLSVSTAALFGLDATAVPDDVFGLLSRFQNGLGNEYVWDKIVVTWKRVNSSSNSNPASAYGGVMDYSSIEVSTEYVINNDGTFSLAGNKSQITCSYNDVPGNPPSLTNYIGYFALTGDGKYLCEITSGSNVSRTTSGSTYGWMILNTTKYAAISEVTHIDYVNSPDPNAYPPAVSDGYTYTALGKLGNKVQIATGSYTGTGTYGSSNPNSLTFDFEPKFLFIFKSISAGNTNGQVAIMMYGSSFYWTDYDGGLHGANNVSFVGNTVSWFNNINETNGFDSGSCISMQFNSGGDIYHYVAIG